MASSNLTPPSLAQMSTNVNRSNSLKIVQPEVNLKRSLSDRPINCSANVNSNEPRIESNLIQVEHEEAEKEDSDIPEYANLPRARHAQKNTSGEVLASAGEQYEQTSEAENQSASFPPPTKCEEATTTTTTQSDTTQLAGTQAPPESEIDELKANVRHSLSQMEASFSADTEFRLSTVEPTVMDEYWAYITNEHDQRVFISRINEERWYEYIDEASGLPYYSDETGTVVAWELPYICESNPEPASAELSPRTDDNFLEDDDNFDDDEGEDDAQFLDRDAAKTAGGGAAGTTGKPNKKSSRQKKQKKSGTGEDDDTDKRMSMDSREFLEDAVGEAPHPATPSSAAAASSDKQKSSFFSKRKTKDKPSKSTSGGTAASSSSTEILDNAANSERNSSTWKPKSRRFPSIKASGNGSGGSAAFGAATSAGGGVSGHKKTDSKSKIRPILLSKDAISGPVDRARTEKRKTISICPLVDNGVSVPTPLKLQERWIVLSGPNLFIYKNEQLANPKVDKIHGEFEFHADIQHLLISPLYKDLMDPVELAAAPPPPPSTGAASPHSKDFKQRYLDGEKIFALEVKSLQSDASNATVFHLLFPSKKEYSEWLQAFRLTMKYLEKNFYSRNFEHRPEFLSARQSLAKLLVSRPKIEELEKRGIIKDNFSIFGSTVDKICEYEHSVVPHFVYRIILAIEARGISTEGIYRIPGNQSNIQTLRFEIDRNPEYKLGDLMWKLDTLTGTLKLFFKELKQPLLPMPLLLKNLAIIKNERYSHAQKIKKIRIKLTKHLSAPHLKTSQLLFEHLHKVATDAHNLMTSQNLAMMLGPNLFSDTSLDLTQSNLLSMMECNNCINFLIVHALEIFRINSSSSGGTVSASSNRPLSAIVQSSGGSDHLEHPRQHVANQLNQEF